MNHVAGFYPFPYSPFSSCWLPVRLLPIRMVPCMGIQRVCIRVQAPMAHTAPFTMTAIIPCIHQAMGNTTGTAVMATAASMEATIRTPANSSSTF